MAVGKQRKKDKPAKTSTARTLWLPAIDAHGGFGTLAVRRGRRPVGRVAHGPRRSRGYSRGTMTSRPVHVQPNTLAEFCRRHHIRRLALFGSVLRPDFRADSDIDVLVEFEPGRTPGLAFFDIEAELTRLLGRRVDLNTPQFLSPRIRKKVQSEAEVLFGPR